MCKTKAQVIFFYKMLVWFLIKWLNKSQDLHSDLKLAISGNHLRIRKVDVSLREIREFSEISGTGSGKSVKI